jgi:hypothetical protein
VPIRYRENATVNPLGNDWDCDRGFRRAGSTCIAIRVPPNARLNVLGNDFECNRGYRRMGSRCEPGY